MRKFQKEQAENIIQIIQEAHSEIKKLLETNSYDLTLSLLAECQECGYSLYDYIADLEGEEHTCCESIAKYCSLVFSIHTEVSNDENINPHNITKRLNKAVVEIHNEIKNNIKIKLEVVFFPYKSSMWDSMESVWIAADNDENCDAYVVPIPYYDRNNDWSFANCYYEGLQYPENVPIVDFAKYNVEERKPDIIYIHNPYDGNNFVTSVAPDYYSEELKKHCELLIYIPYFSTSGDMGAANNCNSAYFNVDYIITQSEDIKKDFHKIIPRNKLIALGSPKFDAVINKCKIVGEIPTEWTSKIENKKVIFFNTSISGMLMDTERFLLKMQYVFKTFENREDTCLLWRPHPLLESTFASMRPMYTETYQTLKEYFIKSGLGIYDDTPNMEKSIALSEAYIGDGGSSVVSLFGMLGKPIFILNNEISEVPSENDWLGMALNNMVYYGDNEYKVVNGKYLYSSEKNKYDYSFYSVLDEEGNTYDRAITVGEKVFITPTNSNKILVYKNKKRVHTIQLKEYDTGENVFANSLLVGKYIFLTPYNYQAIVRIDVETYRVDYIEGYNHIFINEDSPEIKIGFANHWKNFFVITSPVEDIVLFIESDTLNVQILKVGIENSTGYAGMIANGDDIWCLPYSEGNIIKWSPIEGIHKEYNQLPIGFEFTDIKKERPFTNLVFYDNYAIISPSRSNMFVKLDVNTGVMEEWKVPIDVNKEVQKGYYKTGQNMVFIDEIKENTYEMFDSKKRKLYFVNIKTGEFEEAEIKFKREEIESHEIGFGKIAEGLIYACCENAFNTLEDFLNNSITGCAFIKEKQLEAYRNIAENSDGTCGVSIHNFATKKLMD